MLHRRDIEEWEQGSGTSAGKAGHVLPKLTPMIICMWPYVEGSCTYNIQVQQGSRVTGGGEK